MDGKIKVKDLAAEMDISPKDLLRHLNDMGLEAKNAASSIAQEDAAKFKAQHHPDQASEVMRKEVEPGLIIRRRRAKTSEADETSAPEAAPQEAPEATAKASPKAAEPADAQPAAAVASPDIEQPRDTDTPVVADAPKAKRKAQKPLQTPPARIIKPAAEAQAQAQPEAQAEAPTAPQPEAGPTLTEPEAIAAPAQAEDKTEAQKAKAKLAPAASAEPEGSSAPSLLPPVNEIRDEGHEAGADKGRRRRIQPAPPQPQVRIISRPDPSAVRPAAPASPGGARRDDQRPPAGQQRPPRPGGPRPGASSGAPFTPGQPPAESTDQSRKKRNKGRRTVEFSPDSDSFNKRKSGAEEDSGSRYRSRSRKSKKPQLLPQATQPMKAAKRKIRVEEAIRVADLAHQMGIKSGDVIKVLFNLGVMATINNAIDIDTATLVAAEFGYEIEKTGFSEDEFLVPTQSDNPEQLKQRPPVVTIMGHVDHGKTSLLDAIRKTSVTRGEAGGITQHIGAYHVSTKRGDIVFLDTPGHEAFTAMRARGAQVTDIVVLVVAADDGVMEQTREAINHSRAAGVPILVAVNKIDKETANPDRVLRELAEMGLQPEAWGGDTVVSYVSAKQGTGLDELLELIVLQSEIMELKANPDKLARGHVVEAKLDKGRGPVATVLIQEGTLHQGDAFVCGVFAGRVRALFNDQGKKIKEAGPSIPVEIQGFEGVPEAGEEFVSLADEKTARRIADARAVKQREREMARDSHITLETFLARSAGQAETMVLNLVLKADVQGSLEAITESLRKLGTEKVRIEIIHSGAGAISESDVMLAAASNAIIIGFNVRPTAKVKEVAEREKVDVRFYDIIYKLMEDIRSAMAGMLAPVTKEVYLGQAEVRQPFTLPKIGTIAGSYVQDGKITRNAHVRLLRGGVVVYTGKISSLKHIKEDMREVPKGMECGIGLENFNDIKIGDIIEAFDTVEEAATL